LYTAQNAAVTMRRSPRQTKVSSKVSKACLCLSVCVSARISQKPHVQTSQNFPYLLPVAMAQSFSGGTAMCYVLPVLRMMSCFHTMEPMVQNQKRWRSYCLWLQALCASRNTITYLLTYLLTYRRYKNALQTVSI